MNEPFHLKLSRLCLVFLSFSLLMPAGNRQTWASEKKPPSLTQNVPEETTAPAPPEAFPFDEVSEELAKYMERLPPERQVFFLYTQIPPVMRATVFTRLPVRTQTYLFPFALVLTGRKLPFVSRQTIQDLEQKFEMVLKSTSDARNNPPQQAHIGEDFLKSLTPDEIRLVSVLFDEIFPNAFYQHGFPALSLTETGIRALGELTACSPTLAKFVRNGWFVPDRAAGWVTIAQHPILAVPIRLLSPGEPLPSEKTTPKDTFAENQQLIACEGWISSFKPSHTCNCRFFRGLDRTNSCGQVMGGPELSPQRQLKCHSFATKCHAPCLVGIIFVSCTGICVLDDMMPGR